MLLFCSALAKPSPDEHQLRATSFTDVREVPEGHTAAHCAVLRFFALKPGLEPSLLSKGEEQGGLSLSDSPGWSPLM